MADIHDGGQAFPSAVDRDACSVVDHPGMSLRDYFAARAMAAIVTTSGAPCWTLQTEDDGKILARTAYQLADAMLAQRTEPVIQEELMVTRLEYQSADGNRLIGAVAPLFSTEVA